MNGHTWEQEHWSSLHILLPLKDISTVTATNATNIMNGIDTSVLTTTTIVIMVTNITPHNNMINNKNKNINTNTNTIISTTTTLLPLI